LPDKDEPSVLPAEVLDVLKTSTIGYLSVRSPKGDLYSYPVAFYFTGYKVYFTTPISAAKLRFIRASPDVSFLVDNHLLTKGACGAMIQGRAKVFSVAKTVISILSVGPKVAKFAKKYPGMFTFYAKGKEVPDERKLYKYRLIRIDPTKFLFWRGYQFGKYVPKGSAQEDPFSSSPDDTKMETLANLISSGDEELPVPDIPRGEGWVESLKGLGSGGDPTSEERSTIDAYRLFLRNSMVENRTGPAVSADEKRLLKKWKESGGRSG
jgi:nitroimidazol reductase NimA-like FMN-containing flavoprotein (pyridoxamine 5'-phosphate oxidase superfamily)